MNKQFFRNSFVVGILVGALWGIAFYTGHSYGTSFNERSSYDRGYLAGQKSLYDAAMVMKEAHQKRIDELVKECKK